MIRASNITKGYRESLLESASADFPSERVTFLMGANGSGKTTFFKCLLKLESFNGSLTFHDRPFSQAQGEIFAIFDDTPLYPHLNGYSNIELLASTRIRQADLDEAWQLGAGRPGVELLRKPVKTYSSGQRKRLMLAAAVLLRPRYLILDEVASGLDLETMDAAVVIIKELRTSSTIIASGHQFDFYSKIVDQVVVLHNKTMEAVDEYDSTDPTRLEQIYRTKIAV